MGERETVMLRLREHNSPRMPALPFIVTFLCRCSGALYNETRERAVKGQIMNDYMIQHWQTPDSDVRSHDRLVTVSLGTR